VISYDAVTGCSTSPQPDHGPPLLSFFVPGEPRPEGALAIGRGKQGNLFLRHATDRGDLKSWKKSVATVALLAMRRAELRLLREVPLLAVLTFVRNRPRYHFSSKGDIKAAYLRELPSTRPDVDKLTRGVLDAMKGVVYHDDGQVTTALGMKRWCETAGCRVELWYDHSPPDVEADGRPRSAV